MVTVVKVSKVVGEKAIATIAADTKAEVTGVDFEGNTLTLGSIALVAQTCEVGVLDSKGVWHWDS